MFSQAHLIFLPYAGNHERDYPDSGDRFYPLVSAKDSGGGLLH